MDFIFIISIFYWLQFKNSLPLISFLKFNMAINYLDYLNIIQLFFYSLSSAKAPTAIKECNGTDTRIW